MWGALRRWPFNRRLAMAQPQLPGGEGQGASGTAPDWAVFLWGRIHCPVFDRITLRRYCFFRALEVSSATWQTKPRAPIESGAFS